MADYYTDTQCTWCTGCGNYGIWTALRAALVGLRLVPWQVCLCYDVGCHGNGSDKIQGYRAHGVHGRVVPFAAGAKLANMSLDVIALAGDGAAFSEGVGQLVHGIRSNYPITFVLHDNGNYGLTTGQATALTWPQEPMNGTPDGIPERTLSSMELVFALQPTFVARGFSGDIKLMTRILQAAIRHPGFAFVEMLQACPTYNHFATDDYLRQRCYDADAEGHDASDLVAGRRLALECEERIACGVLYQQRDAPSFYDRLLPRNGLATTCVEEVHRYDVSRLMQDLT